MKFVYKLTDHNELVYYGSTILPHKKRLINHKSQNKLGTCKCMSRLLDWSTMEMEVLDEYDDDTAEETLKWKERWYIDNNECVNKYSPITTLEEKHDKHLACRRKNYANNRDIKLVKMKEFRDNNPEKVKEYKDKHKERASIQKKEYYQKNKKKLNDYQKQYHLDNKDYRKQYHLDNKEKILEKARIYREKNKEKLQQKREENREKHRLYMKEKYKRDKIVKQTMEDIIKTLADTSVNLKR